MKNITDINEHDAYSLIRSLGNYLRADAEVSSGTIVRKTRGQYIVTDGHTVMVTISNSAPVESGYPMVVFTQVGLMVKFPKPHRTMTRMRNENNLKVDLSNAAEQNFFPEGDVVGGLVNPHITSEERSNGHTLFPGQSVKFELNITSEECPEIDDLKIRVGGNISRHHLYAIHKEVKI